MKISKVTIDVPSYFFHVLAFLIVTLLAALPLSSEAISFETPSATEPGGLPGIRMAICNSAVITGNVRHISLSGNDMTADGSAARPYRTLYRAVQNAVSQDTLLVHGGTYREPNEIRLRVPGVTIRSQPGEWAIIDRTTRGEWDSGIYFYVGSDYGALTCIEVIGGFYVVSTETKWDWGDPNDRSGSSHLRIENTRLHGSYADVIKIKPNSDDIVIRYNEIFTSGVGQPSNDCNAEGIDNVNGDRTLVAYNHIHDICSTGVYLKGGATDGVVEFNLIERTGGAGILLGFDTSPEYFDTSANPQYYENIRGIARYNLIRNPGWAGIGFYASKDAQAYRNTILNAAAVYHSPIYFGISYQDWEPTAGRPPNENPSIRQNVVVSQSVPRDPALIEIRYANDLGGLSALTGHPRMSDNCYYRLAGPATFHDQRTDWTGNLVAWQAHIQGDVGTYEGDPQLDGNAQPRNPACAGRGYTWNDGPITTYALTVTKTGGNGLITSNPTGIACGATCTADFNRDAQVTLTATPGTGYSFTGWSGACNNPTGTCAVTMDAAKNVTALFANSPDFTLRVAKIGNGSGTVTSSPVGIQCGSDCTESYPSNTLVKLTAIPLNTGSAFVGWSGACAGTVTTCMMKMDIAKNVTAHFKRVATLSIAKSGSGAGRINGPNINCGSDCAETYNLNTVVTLTAAAYSGSTLIGWFNCPTNPTPNQCRVTMSAARTVTARFNTITAGKTALTLYKAGVGLGTVTSTPAGINCGPACRASVFNFTASTTVVLNAVETAGSRFTGWTGCMVNSANRRQCRVTLNTGKVVSATFTRPVLTVRKVGSGLVATPSGVSTGIFCETDCTEADNLNTQGWPRSPGSFMASDRPSRRHHPDRTQVQPEQRPGGNVGTPPGLFEEVLRQMEVRHRKRQAAIDSAYRKQQLKE